MLIAIPKVNKSFSVDLDQERSGGNKAQVLNAVFPDQYHNFLIAYYSNWRVYSESDSSSKNLEIVPLL